MRTLEVAAGIIWMRGRFLAARRPKGKPKAGFWEFPGGKREQGETIEETLCRELHEELGITPGRLLSWKTLLHEYPDMQVNLHFIHVLDFTGTPQPRDGQKLRWVTPEEAPSLKFLPADKSVVAALRAPDA